MENHFLFLFSRTERQLEFLLLLHHLNISSDIVAKTNFGSLGSNKQLRLSGTDSPSNSGPLLAFHKEMLTRSLVKKAVQGGLGFDDAQKFPSATGKGDHEEYQEGSTPTKEDVMAKASSMRSPMLGSLPLGNCATPPLSLWSELPTCHPEGTIIKASNLPYHTSIFPSNPTPLATELLSHPRAMANHQNHITNRNPDSRFLQRPQPLQHNPHRQMINVDRRIPTDPQGTHLVLVPEDTSSSAVSARENARNSLAQVIHQEQSQRLVDGHRQVLRYMSRLSVSTDGDSERDTEDDDEGQELGMEGDGSNGRGYNDSCGRGDVFEMMGSQLKWSRIPGVCVLQRRMTSPRVGEDDIFTLQGSRELTHSVYSIRAFPSEEPANENNATFIHRILHAVLPRTSKPDTNTPIGFTTHMPHKSQTARPTEESDDEVEIEATTNYLLQVTPIEEEEEDQGVGFDRESTVPIDEAELEAAYHSYHSTKSSPDSYDTLAFNQNASPPQIEDSFSSTFLARYNNSRDSDDPRNFITPTQSLANVAEPIPITPPNANPIPYAEYQFPYPSHGRGRHRSHLNINPILEGRSEREINPEPTPSPPARAVTATATERFGPRLETVSQALETIKHEAEGATALQSLTARRANRSYSDPHSGVGAGTGHNRRHSGANAVRVSPYPNPSSQDCARPRANSSSNPNRNAYGYRAAPRRLVQPSPNPPAPSMAFPDRQFQPDPQYATHSRLPASPSPSPTKRMGAAPGSNGMHPSEAMPIANVPMLNASPLRRSEASEARRGRRLGPSGTVLLEAWEQGFTD